MPNLPKRIYLASRSPRRRELLKQVGLPSDVLLLRMDLNRGCDIDESPLAEELPESYVARIAKTKVEKGWSSVVQRGLPKNAVLAADTIVVLDQTIIGKPEDRQHAADILRRLSGRQHQVLTAVAMCHKDRLEMKLSVSSVSMRKLDQLEIKRYIQTAEPLDKAGAYAIQGRAAAFISCLNGSYSGVMGLPLYETYELAERFGYSLS